MKRIRHTMPVRAQRLRARFFVCLGLLLCLHTFGALAARVALVIGNDSYVQVEPLKTARADAVSMAKALEELGFTVTLKQDTDDRALKAALRAFKSRINGGDEAVFFYAGHGVQLGAENFLLPVNVSIDAEDRIKDESLSLQRVLDDLQDKRARFSLAIIDACRNNPLRNTRLRSALTRGLTLTAAATGQMVIYSAGAGQAAVDRLGTDDHDPNGLFTRVFLREMRAPGVPVDRVLRNVREQVVAQARKVGVEQVPAIYDQALGDFYFVPARPRQKDAAVASARSEASAPAASAPGSKSANKPGRPTQMPKPVMRAGDAWTYRNFDLTTNAETGRYSNLITEANEAEFWMQGEQSGNRYWWRGDQRKLVWLERYAFDAASRSQRGKLLYTVEWPDIVPWPLKVGDTWSRKVSYTTDTSKGYHDLTFTVTAVEHIDTPAGRFASFKVVARGTWHNETRETSGRIERIAWYAPGTKREVRFEQRVWNPRGVMDSSFGRELVAFESGRSMPGK